LLSFISRWSFPESPGDAHTRDSPGYQSEDPQIEGVRCAERRGVAARTGPAYARGMTVRERRPASPPSGSIPRTVARVFLGSALVFAGVTHLTVARDEFQAQVPDFVPLDPDTTVLASGVAEIALGGALLLARRRRGLVGTLAALFFTAIFPGNIAQWHHRRDGFGLDTDRKRFVRLFFQPVLVWLALWSTRAPA
jgi:uncharacterized membrane protein